MVEATGINYDDLLHGRISLTDQQVDALYNSSYTHAAVAAAALLPDISKYPDPQQIILVDLMFNMGPGTLAKFHNTLALVKDQNWTEAANNLRESSWFTQVGTQPGQRGWSNVAVLGNTVNIEAILASARKVA